MDQTPDPAAHDGGQPAAQHRHDVDVRVRRSPKFGVFMLLGAVVGALVAWALSAVQPPGVNEAGEPVDTTGVLGLVIVIGIVLGLGVGALVALLVDRSLAKRSRMLVAEQTDTDAAEEPQVAVPPTDAGEASFEPLPHAAADEAAPAEPSDDVARPGDESGERDRPGGA